MSDIFCKVANRRTSHLVAPQLMKNLSPYLSKRVNGGQPARATVPLCKSLVQSSCTIPGSMENGLYKWKVLKSRLRRSSESNNAKKRENINQIAANVNLVYVSDCNSGLVNSCAHAVGVIVAALSNRRMWRQSRGKQLWRSAQFERACIGAPHAPLNFLTTYS